MASSKKDYGGFGVSGVHEITEKMISDWNGPQGYEDFRRGGSQMVIYQDRIGVVWNFTEGCPKYFAWDAWDDGRVGHARQFCPFAEEIPSDLVWYSKLPSPDMELDEIHRAQELMKE